MLKKVDIYVLDNLVVHRYQLIFRIAGSESKRACQEVEHLS